MYLECELRKEGIVKNGGTVFVDCEYNRHNEGKKYLRIPDSFLDIVKDANRKPLELFPDYDVILVSPDIVVHERGNDNSNLLVIELKKKSNPEIAGYDEGKLKYYTRRKHADDFGYQLGFSVVAVDDVPMPSRELKLSTPYANEEPQAEDYGK